MTRGKEGSNYLGPFLSAEARGRQISSSFEWHQDRRYAGLPPVKIFFSGSFSPDETRLSVQPEAQTIATTRRLGIARVLRWVDLGKVSWNDGNKLRGSSVHSARFGNRNGRH